MSLHPDLLEKLLAYACIALLAALAAALARGVADWALISQAIWLHLVTLFVALALTPVMLLRKRGDRLHRVLGWIWSVAMVATALVSLQIKVVNPGGFSPIHVLSLLVLIAVPLLVWRARRHQIKAHRRGVRIVVAAGLIGAGVLTFPGGRLLGHMLLG